MLTGRLASTRKVQLQDKALYLCALSDDDHGVVFWCDTLGSARGIARRWMAAGMLPRIGWVREVMGAA
ncbi:MAG TPA: hypothetical protein VNM39_10790 [Verrucomicrobiae bacterium]|nr:hypothetical protein [Verrucomicrobiae bacterium]